MKTISTSTTEELQARRVGVHVARELINRGAAVRCPAWDAHRIVHRTGLRKNYGIKWIATLLALLCWAVAAGGESFPAAGLAWTNAAPVDLVGVNGRPYRLALVAERAGGMVELVYLDGRSIARTKLSRAMLAPESQELVWGPGLCATNSAARWIATPAQLDAWKKAIERVRVR